MPRRRAVTWLPDCRRPGYSDHHRADDFRAADTIAFLELDLFDLVPFDDDHLPCVLRDDRLWFRFGLRLFCRLDHFRQTFGRRLLGRDRVIASLEQLALGNAGGLVLGFVVGACA